MSRDRIPIDDTNFAETIAQMMRDAGMTRKETAEKAGLRPSTINNWTRAGNDPTLGRLCWVLGALGYRLEAVKEDAET